MRLEEEEHKSLRHLIAAMAVLASLIGSLLSTIYLVGLIERRDRTVAHMGVDSFAVLVVYLGGLALLYHLR